jgi:hypothetical protein
MEFIGWIFGDKALLLVWYSERLQRQFITIRYLIGVSFAKARTIIKSKLRLKFWSGCHARNRGRHWDRTRQ